MVRKKAFYMVYLKGGYDPTFRHDTKALAKTEAERIALKYRRDAYVLKAVLEIIPPPPLPINMQINELS